MEKLKKNLKNQEIAFIGVSDLSFLLTENRLIKEKYLLELLSKT